MNIFVVHPRDCLKLSIEAVSHRCMDFSCLVWSLTFFGVEQVTANLFLIVYILCNYIVICNICSVTSMLKDLPLKQEYRRWACGGERIGDTHPTTVK